MQLKRKLFSWQADLHNDGTGAFVSMLYLGHRVRRVLGFARRTEAQFFQGEFVDRKVSVVQGNGVTWLRAQAFRKKRVIVSRLRNGRNPRLFPECALWDINSQPFLTILAICLSMVSIVGKKRCR